MSILYYLHIARQELLVLCNNKKLHVFTFMPNLYVTREEGIKTSYLIYFLREVIPNPIKDAAVYLVRYIEI